MKQEDININALGMSILGRPVGLTPTASDLDVAVRGENVRFHAVTSGSRELRICDSKGLVWLVDTHQNSVLWVKIRLAFPHHRRKSEHDSADCFQGKVHIGNFTIKGPVSFETGEVVRKVAFPGLSITLVPDAGLIRSISVSFVDNETKADAVANRIGNQ